MFVTPGYAQEPPLAPEVHAEQTLEHERSFPPFDAATFPSQLLWLAITFGLFYLFLQRVVLPRIGGILEVRRDRIAQDLDQAARLREESDAAVAAYEQELAEARAKANTIAGAARERAKADAEQQRRGAEAELGGRLAQAERRIASIRDSAMQDVGAIAEETAAVIVEELIGVQADRRAVAVAVEAAR